MSRPATLPELDAIFREEWGRLVATLTRLAGDIDRAEESAQEALARAVARWPVDGVPGRPGAWLLTTARNVARDVLRRERRERARLPLLADAGASPPPETALARGDEAQVLPDDPLRLIFTCCHPALPREARVALTLRLLGGLSTEEIAGAFLVPESTAAQRIVRAKRAIRDRRLPYRVPTGDELVERLPAVLDVVYLIFNEGYAASAGESLVRDRLCDEALRLARLLVELLPAEPEAHGLLALLELQASRQMTRVDREGRLVLLEDQDRALWDRPAIDRARRTLAPALRGDVLGPYTLQAAIAECHAAAPRFADTDWTRIASLYDTLAERTGSPVVALNRAVAICLRDGPEAALRVVDALAADPKLARSARLPAVRADFLRRAGRLAEAADDYRAAIAQTRNTPERAFLELRLAECVSGER